MLEAKVEAHLVKRTKAIGGEVRKLKWVGRRHAPDRMLMLPEKTTTVRGHLGSTHIHVIRYASHPLIEVKRPGEKARAGQLREHQRLRDAGFEVYVLDTIEKVDNFFDGL